MNYQTMINNDAVFSLYLPAFPPAVGADIYNILAYLIIGEFPAGIIGVLLYLLHIFRSGV